MRIVFSVRVISMLSFNEAADLSPRIAGLTAHPPAGADRFNEAADLSPRIVELPKWQPVAKAGLQ